MNLTIEREESTEKSTAGRMCIDGPFECYTLEDVVREVPGQPVEFWKIPGQTAIPAGTYNVIITPLVRFRRDMPLLENVPGFTGIRIHPGNTDEDTEGCILVGNFRETSDLIRGSRDAFERLFTKIKNALYTGQKVTLKISNAGGMAGE